LLELCSGRCALSTSIPDAFSKLGGHPLLVRVCSRQNLSPEKDSYGSYVVEEW